MNTTDQASAFDQHVRSMPKEIQPLARRAWVSGEKLGCTEHACDIVLGTERLVLVVGIAFALVICTLALLRL